ncbi:MAG: tetratricopeptide repeat protein, partial [Candidatus Aminicenantes bacterium]|nr:tetratricopeptide repeat protein [Candidatus Aminicenantes bacterium]
AAIAQYDDLKKDYPKEYNFRPIELIRLGNHLLEKLKDIDGAIKILEFSVKENPKFSYGYAALAEAYLEKGDKNLAIKNYAKVLELDSKNRNALEKLNEIIKEE